MALTTLSAVQKYHGLGSADAALFSALIPTATAIMQRVAGVTNFEDASYTEFYDGEDSSQIVLRHGPVNSIASVAVLCGTTSTTVASTTYTFDPDARILGFRTGSPSLAWDFGLPPGEEPRFPEGFRNVRVTYNAGYSAVPSDLQQVCNETVMWLYRGRTVNRNVKSEQLGQYGVTLADEQSMTAWLSERLGWLKQTGV